MPHVFAVKNESPDVPEALRVSIRREERKSYGNKKNELTEAETKHTSFPNYSFLLFLKV